MKHFKLLYTSGLAILAAVAAGCAHAPRDTTGFALTHEAVVTAPFEQTWQTVKDVLREEELDIYTRDKRGRFVAYTPEKRRYLQPRRYEYTFSLESLSENETQVKLETRRQVYGVTLLTYPGWHDRKTTEAPLSQALLDAITARASGTSASE